MTIVGVDCATKNRRTGLAFASIGPDGALTVNECFVAEATPSVAAQIHAGLSGLESVLIALDAPLGWPAVFGKELAKHTAGKALAAESDSLFRRRTDLVVKERLGKAPLEVAANFLARTAVVALQTLEELSRLLDTDISLAWHPRQGGMAALEVYPAGTLRAYQRMGFISQTDGTEQSKRSLLRKLQRVGRLEVQPGVIKAAANEHALDSVLCCLAALDFLEGRSIGPGSEDMDLVRKEGWIWVRDPDA